jgi:hypothetical protein
LPAPTDALRAEATDLLESVVLHWTILKKTSVGGLREGFLQRSGRLRRAENHSWLLDVERQGHDVLLNYLPWSYGMIRLPWMERKLITQWAD